MGIEGNQPERNPESRSMENMIRKNVLILVAGTVAAGTTHAQDRAEQNSNVILYVVG